MLIVVRVMGMNLREYFLKLHNVINVVCQFSDSYGHRKTIVCNDGWMRTFV